MGGSSGNQPEKVFQRDSDADQRLGHDPGELTLLEAGSSVGVEDDDRQEVRRQRREDATGRASSCRRPALPVDPRFDLGRIEVQQMAPLTKGMRLSATSRRLGCARTQKGRPLSGWPLTCFYC
jgi:hypothetical protein